MIARPGTRTRNCHGSPPQAHTEPVARPGNRYIYIRHCDYTRQCYRHSRAAAAAAGGRRWEMFTTTLGTRQTSTDQEAKTRSKGDRRRKTRPSRTLVRTTRCLHTPSPGPKAIPKNPYSVDNIMDVWECDLIDVQALSRHNDGVKYLLTVIDVFSKFLHMVPLKSKTG